MGCYESVKPMESSSPQSQIKTRLLRPGYHHVCSKQCQGISSCVDMMLLQLRFSEASISGFSSIITRWTSSSSSTALKSVTATRFDPVLWSPARKLNFVFSVALRGCRHQIIDDVQITQVTVRVQFPLHVLCRTQYRISVGTRTP